MKRVAFTIILISIILIGSVSCRLDDNAIKGDSHLDLKSVVISTDNLKIETDSNGTGTEIVNLTIVEGETLTLHAIARNSEGNFISTVPSNWEIVGNTGSVTVLNGGIAAEFQPVSAGIFELHITYNNIIQSAFITVNMAPAAVTPTLTILNASAINEDAGLTVVKADAEVAASGEGSGVYSVITSSSSDCQSQGTVSVDATNGAVSYTPTLNYNGSCNINIQFDNQMPSNNTVASEFSIIVNAQNDAPTITENCGATVAQGSAYSCTPSVSDVDAGDSHTWALAPANTCAWAAIVPATGALSGTANDNQVGNCTLAFLVNDTSVDSAVTSLTVGVTNVTPTLSITNASTINEDASLTVIRTDGNVASSEEGFGVYSVVTASSNDCQGQGTVSVNTSNGAVSYTPSLNYNGSCNINIQFDDQNSSNNTVTSEFSIAVSAQNDAPVVSGSCAASVNQSVAYSCSPGVVDPEAGDTQAWSFGASHDCGAWMSIAAGTGALSGTPGGGDSSCTVGVKSNDGMVDSNEYTFSLTIVDPSAVGSVVFVTENRYQIGTDFTGITGMNSVCSSIATAKSYPGVWKAVPDGNSLSLVYPIKGLRGDLVESSNIWTGTLDGAIGITEDNNSVSSWVFAGTSADGSASAGYDCSAFTNGGHIYSHRAGYSDSASTNWLSQGVIYCDSLAHIYCISDGTVVTANAAPPEVTSPNYASPFGDHITVDWTSGGGTTTDFLVAYKSGATLPAVNCIPETGTKFVNTSTLSTVITGLNGSTQYSIRICSANGDFPKEYSTGITASFTTSASYNRIFVTDSVFDGENLGGVTCDDEAAAAGFYGSSWEKVMSTSSSDANSLFLGYPIKNTNGQTVAATDLWSGTISASILGPDGTDPGAPYSVFTGSDASGNYVGGSTCSDWGSSGGNATIGTFNLLTSGWLSNGTAACNSEIRFYCVDTKY
ncbi:MAG: hypothetical protein HOO06_11210 [Bdellovibrionaceae bacterium]|jgi:hypothetical protein|nr:hypothetical protein [Pseudobdellovibrionaceae bacterium]